MPHVVRWFSKAWTVVVTIAGTVATGAAANVRELVFALGLGLVAGGLALVSLPAALIVPGSILVWLAIPPSPARKKP